MKFAVAPSKILQALAAHGKPADVALLARLGPSTALFVDSYPYRRQQQQSSANRQTGSTTDVPELDAPSAFAFYCDALERANSAYPLANRAAEYAAHLHNAVPVDISQHMYLFMAAIEIGLKKICEDLVDYWSTAEQIEAQTKFLAESFYTKDWLQTYRVDQSAVSADDRLTRAEFLFGRAAHQETLVLDKLIAAPFFSRNISAYQANLAVLRLHTVAKTKALQVSFSPVKVKKSSLNVADGDEMVYVKLSEDGYKCAEKTVNRAPDSCADWFRKQQQRIAKINDIKSASVGDIDPFLHAERAKFIRLLSVDELAEQLLKDATAQRTLEEMAERAIDSVSLPAAPAAPRNVDPDDDVDDK